MNRFSIAVPVELLERELVGQITQLVPRFENGGAEFGHRHRMRLLFPSGQRNARMGRTVRHHVD